MSTLFSWSTWTRLFGRKATPVKAIKRPVTRKQQQDFADYGTAFGLEMSLSHQASVEQLETPVASPVGKAKRGKVTVQEAVAPVR